MFPALFPICPYHMKLYEQIFVAKQGKKRYHKRERSLWMRSCFTSRKGRQMKTMKRLGLLLMALIMGVGSALAQGAETTVYASSFVAGVDGWYARGAQSVYRTTEHTLRTEGRGSDWHSPGHDFDLVAGNEYKLSVEVYQKDVDNANFMISVAHTKDGSETYENLVKGEASRDTWTTLEGTWTPGDYDRYVLYVETTGAPQLSFEIRNFRVESPNGIPQPKVTEPPMVIEAVENLPSIKEAYAGKFDFGTAVPQFAFNDQKVRKLISEQFSILTPENEMKPDSVLDVFNSKKLVQEKGDETAVAVHFDAAKPLLNFAKENGLKVHGHVLVWHAQTPEAFFHEGYDTGKPMVSREVMLGRLENYIHEVMTWTEENYPGIIVSWDVVNEAIDDGTNWLRKTSNWYKTIGEDFLARAFEYARKYAAEGTLLYYNDYNSCYPGKLNGIIKLLNQLMEEGNIDGYGFQMHHKSGEPSNELIQSAVDKIAAMGLKIRVSELDVGVSSNNEAAFTAQARKYADVMKILLGHSDQVEAVQVWGVTDQMSWRSREYPLLFDAKLNPKPAFFAVLNPDNPAQ